MAKRNNASSVPPENPYEYFSIIYPTNKKGMKEIADLLFVEGTLNPVPYAILDYILKPQVGKSTPTCKTVVIEQKYRDVDHSKALASYYSKSFQRIEAECVRLHFFSRRLPIDFLDSKDTQELERDYLGFCVLRPFPRRKIGRTVLRRLRFQPALEFPTCQGIFKVSLAGHQIKIKGVSFIEQDTMVAACASAAIWMSTTIMGTRFGLQQRSTSEITQLATQYLIQNRPMPSEGLVVEQMLQCIRAMEYQPLLVEVENSKQAKNDIYTYIESEIPPILLCNFVTGEGHAIVGVGHGYSLPITTPFSTKVEWPGETPLEFARSSEWASTILVNDDQRGPYRKLTFIDDKTALEQKIKQKYPQMDIKNLELDEWKCPITIDITMPFSGYNGDEVIANVWGIVVPLPQGVLLIANQAERKSARVIRLWHWLNKVSLPSDLVLRTYLTLSNEYKARALNSGMDQFVKSLIAGKPMPRWIWVTEISSLNAYNSYRPEDWLINGQVLIDATGNAFTPDFLLFHYIVNGQAILATMTPEHEDAEQAFTHYWFSKRDTPYTGWVR